MHIALVCDWFVPRLGGVEMQLLGLARALLAAGHTVEVVTATPGEAVVDGVVVHRLSVPLLPYWKVVYRASVIHQLAQHFRRQRTDVVHAHSYTSPLHFTRNRSLQLGQGGKSLS